MTARIPENPIALSPLQKMLVGGYGGDIVNANGGWAENFEIGRILHLKFEIRNRRLDRPSTLTVQFQTSDFEFQMQDSSNFQIVR
jgi:hypothetical protein